MIYGSSRISILGATAATGPTGNSGPTGPTGNTGSEVVGPTGNTGIDITSIDNLNNTGILGTTFSDGTFVLSTFAIKGPTGTARVGITGDNKGTGITLLSSAGLDYSGLTLRSIRGNTLTSGDLVDVTQTDNEIVVTVDDFGELETGYLNLTGVTSQNSLITFTSSGAGGNPVSIDNTNYDPSTKTLSFTVKDYRETAREITLSGITLDGGNQVEGLDAYSFSINPEEAKLFKIDLNAKGCDPSCPVLFNIESPANTQHGNSFTLIVKGATGTTPLTQRFSSNVSFPFDKEPCFSGSTDILNFFWIPNQWYGNLVKWGDDTETGNTAFGCNDLAPFSLGTNNPFNPGQQGAVEATGACCEGNGICIESSISGCTGFFHGVGTTCGNTGNTGEGICNQRGPCCIYNEIYNSTQCNLLTCDECLTLNSQDGIKTTFGGNGKSCNDISCPSAAVGIGACCNGLGVCEQKDKVNCIKDGGFFRGVGISCLDYFDENICSTGTGSCCLGKNSCIDGQQFDDCLDAGGLYAGNGSTCAELVCPNVNSVSCFGIVDNQLVKPGDLFAGGLVVGIFNPYYAKVAGAEKQFVGQSTTYTNECGTTGEYMSMSEITADIYRTPYDHHGYGFGASGEQQVSCADINSNTMPGENESKPDSYLMVVSLDPVAVDGNGDLVTPGRGVTQNFVWSNYGSSWGPTINLQNPRAQNYGIYDEEYSDIGRYLEGFWTSSIAVGGAACVLEQGLVSSCAYARSLGSDWNLRIASIPPRSPNGFWRRNWGLFNTIRMVNADNAEYINFNSRGNFDSTIFGPSITGGDYTSARAVRLLPDGLTSEMQGITANPETVSPWYLPSHDELGFLASHCLRDGNSPYSFDLNSELLMNGGTPFLGWYWSSTGSFNGNTAGEGKAAFSGTVDGPGSVAWAMKFPESGALTDFKSARKHRTNNKYKVRPIRLIRCDGLYGTTGSSPDLQLDKSWLVPPVLRDI